ncbi:ribosomal protein L11 methyltransferase [Hymenobacter luteus]|uniref:Ribosomal protein L11 methyltransferase n=2 Tax=Hymenobacter TaxID=89966 RepID=A0A7W9T2I9_9BACT|nr:MULTISPECIES: 50S ribosomal protein L11 methyltransferase [Hymenobacter]MBB4602511.1 ribosomal protein L11 methyltransferase [Hymenobacter latericoloratus]MBB6060402.1 ribosomal protein L11 methyltransferase [Hymenobacter luteus]
MDYIELRVQAPRELSDILVAELAEVGFNTFEDNEEGFCAYIDEDQFSADNVAEIMSRYEALGELEFSHRVITRQNWNAEWEKNFQPLVIADKVSVRAPFHEARPDLEYEIVIMPRMSFGTGHHDTTALMIANQLGIDHQGKRVLDMGCGTGILAVMAVHLGAAHVLAVDVEPWTAENAADNAQENNVQDKVEARLGDVTALEGEEPFDIILANINRNVLLEDMGAYARYLKPGGPILFSGFYEDDLPLIREAAEKAGFQYESHRTQNHWVSAVFRQPV